VKILSQTHHFFGSALLLPGAPTGEAMGAWTNAGLRWSPGARIVRVSITYTDGAAVAKGLLLRWSSTGADAVLGAPDPTPGNIASADFAVSSPSQVDGFSAYAFAAGAFAVQFSLFGD